MATSGPELIRTRTGPGRWVLLATILGSGMAFLDSTVVNVALPSIGLDLDAQMSGLQWTVNGYLLTLSALILLGGSLGDRFGRRRVFVIGVAWFGAASVICGLAPNIELLIVARALQGVGGALLTPGSLAIIQASFAPEDRARAIGTWSGLTSVAAAVGPLLGGWLITAVSWRAIFLINVPIAVLVIAATRGHVPESRDPSAEGKRLDLGGAVLAAVGLGGLTYGLIELPGTLPLLTAAGGVAVLGAFVVVQRRSTHPMVPPAMFASRQFTGANLATFAVYGSLGAAFFLLVIHLQQVLGYTALQAGAAMAPITLLLMALSGRAGALAQRIGPRLPMTAGPLGIAAGTLMLVGLPAEGTYLGHVLPGLTVYGLGLALTVAPLTATVLAAAETRLAGVASGVNNAVARAAGLLAVAALPPLAGLTGAAYTDPIAFAAGYRTAMILAAALAAAGGLIALLTIRTELVADIAHEAAGVDAPPLQPDSVGGHPLDQDPPTRPPPVEPTG